MKEATIYSRFDEYVTRRGSSIAVVEDGRSVSYARLAVMVAAIAAKMNVCPGSRVGIVMKHGAEMIAAMLAVLKSGAAYVPAEPSLPADRIDYMMKTADVELVIDDDYCRDIDPTDLQISDRSTPDGAAYILFTSGTTGRPKGVIVENHSVVNYAEAFEREFATEPGDVMLQFSVCSFDIFVEEVFTTLLNGATLAIPSAKVRDGSLEGIMDFCERHGVTQISGFPYLLADMNRRRVCPSRLRLLISGGDVLRDRYVSWLREHHILIYNTYGPSETTVCATYFRVDDAEPLDDGTYSIGKPINGVEVGIYDKHLKELPKGSIGEICIFGEGVARGYLGNPPESTNFVTLPDGRRMYRSGDLGYVAPDGDLHFLRRKDDQVMILGRRVEPEEVENVLNDSPCVERGVVRSFTDESGLAYLVAYFVPSHKNCRLTRIIGFLNEKLADFMIPEFFVKLDEIPLTPRGKVDTRALPVVMKTGDAS